MRRHDLVYLQRDAAFATPSAEASDPSWQAACEWIAAGRPLVAARQLPGSGRLRLGLSLPLRQNRQRLSIDVAPKAVARIAAPLPVARCCSRLSAAEAAVLRRLAEQAAECGAGLGVFGSLSWEVLSGETYRHADSDIDLICDVATLEQFERMLAALQWAAGELPCRLDGELRFPDGNAVAWREMAAQYRQPAAQALIKGPHGVDLQPVQALLATLAEACCHA